MQRTFRAATLAGLAALLMVSAAGAASPAPADRVGDRTTATRQVLKERYTGLYYAVAKHYGRRTPGRNIRKQGVRYRLHGHWHTRAAHNHELGRSIRTFRRWLAPPAPLALATDVAPTGLAAAASYTGGKWAIPSYIVMCESGGNYRALNPSGAGGAYQIMPGTWTAYGGGPAGPQNSSPAEQDRVAARIYAAQGGSPWVCG